MIKNIALYILRFFVFLVIAGGIWLAGLVLFTRTIPSSPQQVVDSTDGIVVFTGGKTRLKVAFSLFEQKKGEHLLISGVNPGYSLPKNIERLPSKSRITLGYSALDTAGNAKETAEWAEIHHIKTLRLITSNYHMARSLIELRSVLPDVQIIPYPVVGTRFQYTKWWLDPSTLSLVIEEYNKFLFSFTRRFFENTHQYLVGSGEEQ